MTRPTANLALLPDERLDLNPYDAAPLHVRDDTEVVVGSRRGSIQVGAHLTNEVLPGQVFLAFHFRVGVLVFVGSSGPSGDVVR